MRIRVLSMWQPWASLLVGGLKRVETRSRHLHESLPAVLAIHATKVMRSDCLALCRTEPFCSALRECGYEIPDSGRVSPLPQGAILGLGLVTECVGAAAAVHSALRLGESLWDLSETAKRLQADPRERLFGDYRGTRWAFLFERVIRLAEPIHYSGSQCVQWWDPPAEVWPLVERLREG